MVTIEDNVLSLKTTIPNKHYPNAGIHLKNARYSIDGSTLSSGNGYFLFSVSDIQTATFQIEGPEGNLAFIVCLNGTGNTYSCEEHIVAIPDATPTLTTYSAITGSATGKHLIPGLGIKGSNNVHFYGLALLQPDVCDPTTTISNYTEIPITLNSGSLTSPDGFPNPCIAICNSSVTSPTYPGPSDLCTNAILVTR